MFLLLLTIAWAWSTPITTYAQAASLDFQIIDNLNWSNDHLTATQVTETYDYDPTTDTITISYQFDQVGFAPLPPMLAIAYQYGFPVTVSKPLVETGYFTELGPLMGVENTDSYQVTIKGLGKYVTEIRLILNHSTTDHLASELQSQVSTIIQKGHLSPALVVSNEPGGLGGGSKERGHMYWYNPGDTYYFLSEYLPFLSDQGQAELMDYLTMERTNYPPETLKSLSFSEGMRRTHSPYLTNTLDYWWYDRYIHFRTHGDPRIWNLYGLSKYYEALGAAPTQAVINQATHIINQEMAYRDWATLYWQFPHWPEYNAVHSVNQLFAGLIGYIRLARLANDQVAQDLGWGLFARMSALRFSLGKYTQFEYDTDQFIIDPDICGSTNTGCTPRPDWWAQIVQNNRHRYWTEIETNWGTMPYWWLQLTTQDWTEPIDNVRQVHKLDDKGVDTWEWFGWGQSTGTYDGGANYLITDGQDKSEWWQSKHGAYLLPFADITPELGRFLKDYLQAETATYINRVDENLPSWHMSYAEPIVGREQGFMMPVDSHSLFMASAWVLDASPQKLEELIDYSWFELGDYFYLHKLSETIKAYRGWCWSQDGVTCSDETGNSPWGDLNHDQAIDFADYSLFLPAFNAIYNLFDFNKLVSWFGSLM